MPELFTTEAMENRCQMSKYSIGSCIKKMRRKKKKGREGEKEEGHHPIIPPHSNLEPNPSAPDATVTLVKVISQSLVLKILNSPLSVTFHTHHKDPKGFLEICPYFCSIFSNSSIILHRYQSCLHESWLYDLKSLPTGLSHFISFPLFNLLWIVLPTNFSKTLLFHQIFPHLFTNSCYRFHQLKYICPPSKVFLYCCMLSNKLHCPYPQ